MEAIAERTDVKDATLYQISGEVATIIQVIEDIQNDAELSNDERDKALADALERFKQSKSDLDVKITNCNYYNKQIGWLRQAVKDEKRRLDRIDKMLAAREDWFKRYVIWCLELVGRKFKSPLFGVTVSFPRRNKVDVFDESLLPTLPKFWSYADPTPNKVELKKALKIRDEIYADESLSAEDRRAKMLERTGVEEIKGAKLIDGEPSLRWS